PGDDRAQDGGLPPVGLGGVRSMANDELCWMPAADLAAGIARRKISPVEVVDAVLARIEALERLNAYVTVDAEGARHAARAAERAVMRKGARLGPLHGVPFSVKDLVVTKGVRTTFGTPIYKDNVPTEDAPMVARLKAAGAVMIGKTNTPTFGWIGATHNLLIGATRNPWNLERTPGGSSGGAAAAVAAGLAPLAVGTDGGGSIRIPASFSGIYGLKPTFGRIPIHPPSAAWSLSHVGPMARTVRDAALMLQVSAGPDERDASSLPAPGVDYVKALRGGVKGLRVAYSDTLGYAEVVDPEVREACGKAARAFRELGCRVEELDPGRRVFEGYDLLLTPTLARPAFAVGLDNATEIAGRPVPEWAWSPFTYPFNLTGQPAASVPCGFTKGGLPIGLQVVGRRFDDATVLRASAAFEAARPWAQNRPPLP